MRDKCDEEQKLVIIQNTLPFKYTELVYSYLKFEILRNYDTQHVSLFEEKSVVTVKQFAQW